MVGTTGSLLARRALRPASLDPSASAQWRLPARQPPLLAEVHPHEPQLIVGELFAEVVADWPQVGAAADLEGGLYLAEPVRRRQEVGQVQDVAPSGQELQVAKDCGLRHAALPGHLGDG